LTELVSLRDLQRIQDAFALATGVASVITAPDGWPLTRPSNFTRLCRDLIRATPRGLENCTRSDAVLGRPNPVGPNISPCLSCGLWDGGASVFAGEQHIANWLVGQVRNEALDTEVLAAYAADIGVDDSEFRQALDEVPVMSLERFRHVCEFLFVMANQLSQLAFTALANQRTLDDVRRDMQARTATEAKVRHEQKLAAVGRLAGGVAHDFNNVLTVIHGNAELLADAPVAEDFAGRHAAMLSEIVAAAERGAQLTRQLLAFGRKQLRTPTALDINQLLTSFEPLLRRALPENIALHVGGGSEPLVVFADRNQVEQVLLNLVTNARDAITEGGDIRVDTERVVVDDLYAASQPDLTPGAYVLISVRDTGVGIPREVLDKIFEPFFTTKALGQGTGLGLASVHGVVHQAGGTVGVESEAGHGSTFRVYLPESAAPPAVLSGPPPSTVRSGDETVLVCEGDPAVRVLTVRILREAGYRVLAARAAEEASALSQTHRGPIHLLVTDVVQPGEKGGSVVDEIRRAHPEVRVLFVSGFTTPVTPTHGRPAAGARVLEKPYTRQALLTRARAVLDAR
jgi:signal transduction histidine kinase/CheY-like chemotaxis protein